MGEKTYDRQREHARAAVELPVVLEWKNRRVRGITLNVSEQGVRVRTSEPLHAGKADEVMIELAVPDRGGRVHVLGWVADAAANGAGDDLSLTFFALPEKDVPRLRALVAAQARRHS